MYVLALAGNGGVVPCSYTAHTPHTSIIMGDVCAMLCYVVCPVWARYGPCEGEVWAMHTPEMETYQMNVDYPGNDV